MKEIRVKIEWNESSREESNEEVKHDIQDLFFKIAEDYLPHLDLEFEVTVRDK